MEHDNKDKTTPTSTVTPVQEHTQAQAQTENVSTSANVTNVPQNVGAAVQHINVPSYSKPLPVPVPSPPRSTIYSTGSPERTSEPSRSPERTSSHRSPRRHGSPNAPHRRGRNSQVSWVDDRERLASSGAKNSDSDNEAPRQGALPPIPSSQALTRSPQSSPLEDVVPREAIQVYLPHHPHPDPRAQPLNGELRMSVLPQSQGEYRAAASDSTRTGDEKPAARKRSAGERLYPTLETAKAEKKKCASKARWTGIILNVAIGLQVLLGSLTTGLSVATSGHQTQVFTAILGGIATLVASYLARSRGSNEPELSIARVKDLEQFIRECEAFQMDHGHVTDGRHDDTLLEFRRRFEDLLGNGDGQRRLSNV